MRIHTRCQDAGEGATEKGEAFTIVEREESELLPQRLHRKEKGFASCNRARRLVDTQLAKPGRHYQIHLRGEVFCSMDPNDSTDK